MAQKSRITVVNMALLVTGAAGFIGCNLVRKLIARLQDEKIVSYDALTYAGNLESLQEFRDTPNHFFVHGDICDQEKVRETFEAHDVTGVLHLAAESHVDRSIVSPLKFIDTNVKGTAVLLQVARSFWKDRDDVRFLHVSTDEVFGSLGDEGFFSENTPYAPRSPYSASKASADHMARAWAETYDLPVLVTNCTNNYGPFQFPEKLLPLVIVRALSKGTVPVYGEGTNIRDWLFVEDHCDALIEVFLRGEIGETYCIGGRAEWANLALVETVLDEVDRQEGRAVGSSRDLVEFVKDRPGHDFRYAMDINKIETELGWEPSVGLEQGIERTVRWYRENRLWWERVMSGEYREFEKTWYDGVLG